MDDARIETLKSMPVFGGLRTETLEFLLDLCPIISVAKDDYFFREADDGNSMFVLETGRAEVLKSWDGKNHQLHTFEAGDCFGEMAVMDLGARSASVRALEDCRAIEISAANLYKITTMDMKQFAMIHMNMGREVCRRLRAADEKLFSARMESQEE